MSFKKRNADQQPKLPPGTRLSAYNGQLLISTGVPSLDDILGGGQPVGTIMLIKEDRATTYAQLLLKYFLAQGISSGHHCAIASRDEDPEEMLKTLMWLSTSDRDDDEESETTKNARNNAESDRLKIAWRYSHLKRFETTVKAKPASPTSSPVTKSSDQAEKTGDEPKPYCSQFDLTKRIPSTVLDEANTHIMHWGNDIEETDNQDDYKCLLNEIQKVVLKGNFSSAIPVAPGTPRHALRVAIHSLASPSWRSKSPHDLYKFCHALRGLLRFSFGTAIITVPAYLYDEVPYVIKRIEHMVDAVIEIESFAGDPVHNEAAYIQNYHGFFHVHKLPVLNSLLPPSTKLSVLSGGGSNDLGFKLRRKRFAIETFHLPPEGGVVTRRTEPPSSTTKTNKRNNSEQQSDVIKSNSNSIGLSSLANRGPKKLGPGVGCGSLPGKVDPLEF
ncbi:Elongator complex protein 4 [Cokeromyces recurvatus]|uniref:Elongator complex protein 4 n=1 Tax=Cokeromyces recurvatus TaxID=90255 RepID=UPI00221E68F9|nr:Elongator complex protein 4 [Cokeromyces recurvatus]KAI7904975.1 Elongator complex protein 4 [Cokeromyces recurvatus]